MARTVRTGIILAAVRRSMLSDKLLYPLLIFMLSGQEFSLRNSSAQLFDALGDGLSDLVIRGRRSHANSLAVDEDGIRFAPFPEGLTIGSIDRAERNPIAEFRGRTFRPFKGRVHARAPAVDEGRDGDPAGSEFRPLFVPDPTRRRGILSERFPEENLHA